MPAVLTFASIRGATEDEQQCYEALEFQPTCPVRGTTRARRAAVRHQEFQSTRPLRGATRCSSDLRWVPQNFNPRAPYGARQEMVRGIWQGFQFQSTCPVRGTTVDGFFNSGAIHISIHVPRTGHDRADTKALCEWFDFNPRAPYGARRPCGGRRRCRSRFQSTCPVRGTTRCIRVTHDIIIISIHVPRTGHDRTHSGQRHDQRDFNPRAPYGARLLFAAPDVFTLQFQSTCPVRGTTVSGTCLPPVPIRFQSTCPVRGTTKLKVIHL